MRVWSLALASMGYGETPQILGTVWTRRSRDEFNLLLRKGNVIIRHIGIIFRYKDFIHLSAISANLMWALLKEE